jgi:hypothetical protein
MTTALADLMSRATARGRSRHTGASCRAGCMPNAETAEHRGRRWRSTDDASGTILPCEPSGRPRFRRSCPSAAPQTRRRFGHRGSKPIWWTIRGRIRTASSQFRDQMCQSRPCGDASFDHSPGASTRFTRPEGPSAHCAPAAGPPAQEHIGGHRASGTTPHAGPTGKPPIYKGPGIRRGLQQSRDIRTPAQSSREPAPGTRRRRSAAGNILGTTVHEGHFAPASPRDPDADQLRPVSSTTRSQRGESSANRVDALMRVIHRRSNAAATTPRGNQCTRMT